MKTRIADRIDVTFSDTDVSAEKVTIARFLDNCFGYTSGTHCGAPDDAQAELLREFW